MSKCKKTALYKIVVYLRKRSTGATAYEIAKYAKVNYNTVRRILGEMWRFGPYFDKVGDSKCRVTGKILTTYRLA